MPTYKTKMSDPNGSSQQNVLGTNSEKSKADCTALSLHFLPYFIRYRPDRNSSKLPLPGQCNCGRCNWAN